MATHIACRRRLVARLPKIPHLLSCFLLLPHSSPPLHSCFLATLFVGFSLTPTANLAGSDKTLKSSAGVSHSGWAGPSWMRAVHRAEVGAHMAGGRGRKAPLPAVVGRERQAQVAQSQLRPRRSQTMKYIPTSHPARPQGSPRADSKHLHGRPRSSIYHLSMHTGFST